ncbi:MAG: hypothetical protein WCO81_09215 [Cyanobacteriota bacterium ELA615]
MKILQILSFIGLFVFTRPAFAMNLNLGSGQQFDFGLSSQRSLLISGAMPLLGPAPLFLPLGGLIEVPPAAPGVIVPDSGNIIANPPSQAIVPDTGSAAGASASSIALPLIGALALAGIIALLLNDSSSSSLAPSTPTPEPIIPPIQEVPEPSFLPGILVFGGYFLLLYRYRK